MSISPSLQTRSHRRICAAGFAAILIGVLAGCNLASAPAAPDLTPTSESTGLTSSQVQATLPPTVTPAPPLPPTPALSPSQAITQARKLAHDGYYEEAQRLFRVAAADADPAQALTAAAGYAVLAVREGGFEEALRVLTDVLERYPDAPQAAHAYFLRGEANLGLARWTSAINDYRRYLTLRAGVIDSYVYERIADAFLALGMTDDAVNAYALATSAGRARLPQAALRERAAQVYLSLGMPARAMAEYDAILTDAQNRAYQADIGLRAASAARDAGDASAPLRYKTLFENYIDLPAIALPAMGALAELGVAVSEYDRGRAYFYAEDYTAAIEAFNAHTTSVVLMDIPPELYLLLGRAYRGAGNLPAAQIAFRTIIEQYPTSALFGDAALEQGRTHFMSDDTARAITTYLSIADTYPNLPATAAEALWRAGYLYSEIGSTAEALAVFARLNETYPTSEQARTGAGIAAAAARRAGDTLQAEQWYRRYAAATSGETQAEAYGLVGQLAAQRGASDEAQQAYDLAIAANPDGYTAARLREQRAGLRPFQPPASAPLVRDDSADRAAAEAWLRQTFSLTAEVALGTLPDVVQTHPSWIRGSELWAVGQFRAAEDEFIALLGAFASDGPALYGLSLALRELGAYYPSQQAAADLLNAARSATLSGPAFIGRLRFPAPYPDVMQRIADDFRVDVLLLLSLIRTESLFDTYATAAAGEKGLTQVIPSTASYIAGLLEWPDYQHEDLFRPYAGITFGAAYLAEQLALFDGNAGLALSAYNAGPGRGIAWRDASNGGQDFDALLSAISISSTRGYVQRIYTFYAIYRQLYGQSAAPS